MIIKERKSGLAGRKGIMQGPKGESMPGVTPLFISDMPAFAYMRVASTFLLKMVSKSWSFLDRPYPKRVGLKRKNLFLTILFCSLTFLAISGKQKAKK